MKNNNALLIILGIVLVLGIAMLPWSGSNWGLCSMMGNWNYGSGGYGYGQLISWITNIAVLILIVLGITWLYKNIGSKK